MERRRFLKYLAGIATIGATQVLSFDKGEGLKTGQLQLDIGPTEAHAVCGNAYNCSGGGGKCGNAYNCSGGGGKCGNAYNCSGN